MKPMIDNVGTYIDFLLQTAGRAGEKILKYYRTDIQVEHKADNSPVTAADIASHDIIVAALNGLPDRYPVVSEEDDHGDYTQRAHWSRHWLVDPLDGTREFINKRDSFCINIGLVEGHSPILGIVHVPVQDCTYYAWRGHGAFVKRPGQPPQRIRVAQWQGERAMRIAVSRSHPSGMLHQFLEKFLPHETVQLGSALKMCMVAEGAVDFYPRFGPTWEWDTAAAQCVVEEAGGTLTDVHFKRLQYNVKPVLTNPPFLVFGDVGPQGRTAIAQAIPEEAYEQHQKIYA